MLPRLPGASPRSACSSREPMPTQKPTVAERAPGICSVSTRRPLGCTVRRMSVPPRSAVSSGRSRGKSKGSDTPLPYWLPHCRSVATRGRSVRQAIFSESGQIFREAARDSTKTACLDELFWIAPRLKCTKRREKRKALGIARYPGLFSSLLRFTRLQPLQPELRQRPGPQRLQQLPRVRARAKACRGRQPS